MIISISRRNRTTDWLGFMCAALLGSGLCTIVLISPGTADESADKGDPRFSRESLEELRDVLGQASDRLYLWNRANRAYLQSIAPPYVRSGAIAELREMGEANAEIKELSTLYDHAGKMAELAAAISGDLEDKKPFLSLGSHTIEVALKHVVEYATDSDRVAKALRQGLISPLTGKALGYLQLEYGGGDMIAAAERLLFKQGDQVEAWATLWDGINKSAWAGLGYAISGGNSAAAKTFSIIGDIAVQSGRAITAPMFTAYNNWTTGTDHNLIQIWTTAQTARRTRGENVQSFEEFYRFDSVILGQVSEVARRSADARFGLRSPSRPPDHTEIQIVTRTFQGSYREICKAGFCVQTDLSATTASPTTPHQPSSQPCSAGGVSCQPSSAPAGVFIAPTPKRSGSIDDAAGRDILSLPRLGPAH